MYIIFWIRVFNIYKELPNKIYYLEDLVTDMYTSDSNLKLKFVINIENIKLLWKKQDFSELI